MLYGGEPVRRPVELGKRGPARTQVLSGLAAGERVATDPVAALAWLRSHQQPAGITHD